MIQVPNWWMNIYFQITWDLVYSATCEYCGNFAILAFEIALNKELFIIHYKPYY
jgi:hypothetical protein